MIRETLRVNILQAIYRKFGKIAMPDFGIIIPENPEHGDYATNAALILAKQLKKPPMEIAAVLESEIKNQELGIKIKIAPPGFINFGLPREQLYNGLVEILKHRGNYGKFQVQSSKFQVPRINIEFISANPTGPLTIGNGRGAFLGEALAKVLSFYGFKVTREYYINDARASTQIKELGKTILGKGTMYKGKYTDEIRKRLAGNFNQLKGLSIEDAGYAAAQEIQKDNRKFIEETLKIGLDVWYEEEKLYKNRLVEKVFETLSKKGAIYVKDNAHWFRASNFGDSEDRVAIRADGAPTYFLPDVAYHAEKLTRRKFNKVLDILGADHHGTFPRVLAGMRALGLDDKRVSAIFTQLVRLVRGGREIKISKRRGKYVTLEDLIKAVGQDCARYFFLEKSPDTHMDFDLDLAKERSVKNPVYYIQYAHARISSIFHKVKNRRNFNLQFSIFKLLKGKGELDLIKKLIQFPEVLEDTANDYQIHRLTRYAYELARLFHNFYEKHQIISEDKELTLARLALTKAVQIVLRSTFGLLGISAPLQM